MFASKPTPAKRGTWTRGGTWRFTVTIVGPGAHLPWLIDPIALVNARVVHNEFKGTFDISPIGRLNDLPSHCDLHWLGHAASQSLCLHQCQG